MGQKKILIVDDEVDLVETLRFPLQMEGFNVLVSYNGEDALNQARKENPDLIILDLMLPKLIFCSLRVRQNSYNKRSPRATFSDLLQPSLNYNVSGGHEDRPPRPF